MRYLWVLLFAFLMGCDNSEEEPLIWDKSDFYESVPDDIKLVGGIPFNKLFAFFKMEIELKNPFRMGSDDVFYFVKHDSVVATFNGERINLNFEFKEDTVVVSNSLGFVESGRLELTFWGSWYYQDRMEPRYTDGEPVFIETIHQIKSVDIVGELPFKALVGFVENDNDNSVLYIPEIELHDVPERNYRRSGIDYKFELEYGMQYKDFDIKVTPVRIGDKIIRIRYYWVLSPGEKHIFSATAKWYYMDEMENWKACDGFEEYIEKEVVPVE